MKYFNWDNMSDVEKFLSKPSARIEKERKKERKKEREAELIEEIINVIFEGE